MEGFLYGMLIGGFLVVAIDKWEVATYRACESQHNTPHQWVLEPKE